MSLFLRYYVQDKEKTMEKGAIYYSTMCNVYYVITTDVSLENTVECMIIDGYQTQHKYLTSMIVAADRFEKYDKRYVQVGGIY